MKKSDPALHHSLNLTEALDLNTHTLHKVASHLGDFHKHTTAINLLQEAVDKLTIQNTSITQQLASIQNQLNSLPTLEALNPALKDHFALLETSFQASHKIFRENLAKTINDFVATQREKQLKLLEQLNTRQQQEQNALVATSHEHSIGFKQQLESSLATADTNLQASLAKLSTDIIEANYNWHRIYLVIITFIALLLFAHQVFYVPSPFNHSEQTEKSPQHQPLNPDSDKSAPSSSSDDQHKPASSNEESKKNPSHNSKK